MFVPDLIELLDLVEVHFEVVKSFFCSVWRLSTLEIIDIGPNIRRQWSLGVWHLVKQYHVLTVCNLLLCSLFWLWRGIGFLYNWSRRLDAWVLIAKVRVFLACLFFTAYRQHLFDQSLDLVPLDVFWIQEILMQFKDFVGDSLRIKCKEVLEHNLV